MAQTATAAAPAPDDTSADSFWGPQGPRPIVIPRGRPTPKPDQPPSIAQSGQSPQGGNAWDDLPDWSPPAANDSTPGWNDLPDWKPPAAASATTRDVGTPEALGRGALDTATFGTAPAIAGLADAGKTAEAADPTIAATAQQATPAGPAGPIPVLAPVVGATKMLADWITGSNDPAALDAYQRGRDSFAQDQRLAQEQHPTAFIAGQLAGALASPALGAVRGTTAVGKIGAGMAAGAGAGGLYSAGTDVGQGTPVSEIPLDTAEGALTGAAFGGGGAAAGQVAGKVGSKVASIVRGSQDTDTEASRRVVNALTSDLQSQGPSMGPDEIAAANAAGTPRMLVDAGGERTRALARSAANTSPEARQALTESTSNRFETQTPRIAGFVRRLTGGAPAPAAPEPQAVRIGRTIRGLTGGADAAADLETLQTAARRANRPAYQRAYQAGDREIWSPELERLTSAPSIRQAMTAAVNKWKDWQVVDGFGGVNPGATVAHGGQLNIARGRFGVPTFPNIQFWDYTARNIADKAEAARRAGRMQLAAQLGGLERQLKEELDRQVPEYRTARRGAAQFFGAGDALEAGRMFAASNADIGQARLALGRMSAPERELFARGYSSALADQVERHTGAVLDSPTFATPAGRQKLEMSLGGARVRALDTALAPDRLFHSFEGATTAAEAGSNFVMSNAGMAQARQALSQMTPADRELFARGFASNLADKIERTGDRRNVINSIFLGSVAARQKIALALGPNRARMLEAMLRAETIVDEARKALGNSSTARQLGEMGLAGGAVATFEGLKEHDFNPAHIIAAALTYGAVRHGAKIIDEKVARRVGEMLASDDPAVLTKGIQVATSSPVIFDALRRATASSSRVAAHDIGGRNAAAAIVGGAQNLGSALTPEKDE